MVILTFFCSPSDDMEEWQIQGNKQSHFQHNVHWDYYIVATAFVVIIIHKHKFVALMFMPNKSIIILLQLATTLPCGSTCKKYNSVVYLEDTTQDRML